MCFESEESGHSDTHRTECSTRTSKVVGKSYYTTDYNGMHAFVTARK